MRIILILSSLVLSSSAYAMSIDWSGGYRIEYNNIENPTLDLNKKQPKTYGLQFLYLSPKIVASDGVNIIGRFDILGSQVSAYRNSQLGTIFGSGGGTVDPRVNSDNQETSTVNVSQLYLNVNQEYGSLVVGRAPFQFGLGITHNAGLGAFDHWYDTRDMAAYKFIIDNISITPMLAKVSQKDFGRGVTASDEIIEFDYNNKDIGAEAGVVQQTRHSSKESNDALATSNPLPITGASLADGWTTKTVNLYLGRTWESFKFKLEASFITGDTGLLVSGSSLKYNAYAVAAEILFPAKETEKWEFGAKLGMASGDNPNTTGVYEGYQFDRNYDVAMLMFNHRQGQADFLTTGITHNDGTSGLNTGNSADDESIGNAMYIAPSVKYKWNDKFDIHSTLIYAQLSTKPTLSLDTSKDLGTELDIEFIYRPRERVIWSNEIGLMLPGAAWKDGASNYATDSNYGFTTKAAITF